MSKPQHDSRYSNRYDLIENMTAHHNDWDTSTQRNESSSSITSSFDMEIAALKAKMAEINKNLMRVLHVNQQVKAVTPNCETCGGPHSYIDCSATVGQTQNVYAAGAYQGGNSYQPQVVTTNEFTNFMKANDVILKNMQTNMTSLTNSNLELKNMFGQFMKMNTASSSGSGALPVERETEVTKDTVPPTDNESTKDVQTPVVQIETPVPNSEPIVAPIIELVAAPVMVLLKKLLEKQGDPGKFLIPCDFPGMAECLALADLGASINLMPLSVWNKLSLPELSPTAPKPNQKPSIPYPSKLHDLKLRDKANDQKEKFFHIFQDLNFNISFANALILMPKFGPTIKTFLTNKDKLSELARTPLNEHCSAVLLKKLPEKLGDPDKFLISCDFLGMAECLALANLGASINLMPLSVWNKLSFPKLSPMCMTLELADRSISRNYLPQVRKKLKICEAKTNKSSIDEPPEVELKDLPPHLEYVFLEGDDKLPVIIVKDLSVEKKTALITVLKSHKRAITWKLSDIKGINPEFCTHKILMEDSSGSTPEKGQS
nr:reverse transcriptase domain-containing protein [Tanacetum cinerariifolium]